MTNDELNELLTFMELCWPRGKSDDWKRAYAMLLADLPGPAALAAMKRLAKTSSFPPAVADIRRGAAEHLGVLQGPDGAHQALQWAAEVRQAQYRHADPPEPPTAHAGIAVAEYGGIDAVLDDPAGWKRWWARRAKEFDDETIASEGLRLGLALKQAERFAIEQGRQP